MLRRCECDGAASVDELCYNIHIVYREVCRNEFIIPLGPELDELYTDAEMCHSLRSLQTESVRPQLKMTEIA